MSQNLEFDIFSHGFVFGTEIISSTSLSLIHVILTLQKEDKEVDHL